MSADTGLQTVTAAGRLGGLGNFLAKENHEWWGTRRLWFQPLLWILILNGILFMVIFVAPSAEPSAPPTPIGEAMAIFFQVAGIALSIAMCIQAQDALVGEKQTGTAAWILSKPVTRQAFIVSKLIANTAGMLALQILPPSLVTYGALAIKYGNPPSLVPFLGGMGVVALLVFFYLALGLMLGAIFSNRGPVIGISMAFLFSGSVFVSLVPQSIIVTPWGLANLAGGIAAGAPLPSFTPIPIALTAVYSLVMIVVALARFTKEEF